MNGKEYQDMAMRTNDGGSTDRLQSKLNDITYHMLLGNNGDACRVYALGGILNGCLGLAGESGEFCDMIKKWIFHEKPLDVEHAQKEIGDLLWYIAMICHSFKWDMDSIMEQNIEKLKARYPEGFDVMKSAHRAEGDV